MTDAKPSAKRSSSAKASGDVFSEEELAAMQDTIRERKRAAKLTPEEARAAGEADVQAAIAKMAQEDRAMAARVHGSSWRPRRTSCPGRSTACRPTPGTAG